MPNIGIIILAAGKSQRLGSPKQLLKIAEKSLIQHIAGIAESSNYTPIVTVLGSDFELIKKEIENFSVSTVYNPNWEKGMGTSISKGVEEIQKRDPNLNAVIILLVDQPLLKVSLLNDLVKIYKHANKKIIASKYDKTVGVPALFDKTTFEALVSLDGKKGAKKVIQNFNEKEQVAFIDFPEGRFDLDTPSDYERFLDKFGEK